MYQKTDLRFLNSPAEEEESGFRPSKVRGPPLDKTEPIIKQVASRTTRGRTLGAIEAEGQDKVIETHVLQSEVRGGVQTWICEQSPWKRTSVALGVWTEANYHKMWEYVTSLLFMIKTIR